MIKRLPLYYHPTAAIFVDDQEAFIHSTLAIVENLTDCRSFLDPQEALKYVKSIKSGSSLIKQLEKLDEHTDVLLTQKDLADYLGSLDRFKLETTLVVDYAMPKINGLEFFETVESKFFEKIMLTGEASSAIAIKAFNRHLIDRFIYKDSPKVFEELNNALLELRMEYFEGSTKNLLLRHLPSFLSSLAFKDFFMQIFHKVKGVEYYLVNVLGDFLILDEEGHGTWVCVRDQETHDFTFKFIDSLYLDERSDDLSFVRESLKSTKYLFNYGFGEFDNDFKEHVLNANSIKFDEHQCHYAMLPIKLDFPVKPLNLQHPKYTLSKDNK